MGTSLFWYYGTGDLGNQAVRMGPEGFSLTESADSGTLAMSRIRVDDVAGTLNLVGHHSFVGREYACSWDSLFRGYFADRTIKRQDSLLTGVKRIWDCNVYDLNAALEFEVIRGSSGLRPKETDTARLAWLLGSGYTGPIDTHDDHVFGAGVNLDKADYRGQTMTQVLIDCAQESGNNYFVAWDDTRGAPMLHYYDPTRAHNTSTLKISNVLADVDGSTVFAPSSDAAANYDPSRVFSGVYYQYGEKTSAEYRTSATVLANIGHKRETAEQNSAIRTPAKADAAADKWLSEGEAELLTVSLTLRNVSPTQVNLIRAGQRIQVKMTHIPGLTSYTYMRVVRRTVEQDGMTQLAYQLQLELANPKQGGSKRKPGNEVAPDLEDGSALTLTRACLTQGNDQDDGHGGIADSFSYSTVVPDTDVTEAVVYSTTYIYGNCPIGQNLFNGLTHKEQWLQFNPGSLTGIAGVSLTFTAGTRLGILGSLFSSFPPLEYGYLASGPPTAAGQGIVLGQVDAGGGSIFIPASVLNDSATNYIFLRASWQAISGAACSGTLVAGNNGPLGISVNPGGGEFDSGSVIINWSGGVLKTVSGSGSSPWLALTGAINGSNKTYTLPGWNLTGTPRIRIGAVEYNAGEDYTFDPATGTITMRFAPWTGAILQGRYLL